MDTARAGLKRWPISSGEKAAMEAAVAHVQRIMRGESTPQDLAQAQAMLQALNEPRQTSLPLRLKA